MSGNLENVSDLINELQPALDRGEFDTVAAEIRRLREQLLQRERREEAALASSVLADVLTQSANLDGALEAYKFAEQLSPIGHFRVLTAQHLLHMGRTEDAARKLDDILLDSAVAMHRALALRGMMSLAGGDDEAACDFLGRALVPARAGNLPALFWDLRLVERLVRRGRCEPLCREYLTLLRALCERERSDGRLAEVDELLRFRTE